MVIQLRLGHLTRISAFKTYLSWLRTVAPMLSYMSHVKPQKGSLQSPSPMLVTASQSKSIETGRFKLPRRGTEIDMIYYAISSIL